MNDTASRAREFVRSNYGKPQTAEDALAQDALAFALLTPFAEQEVRAFVEKVEIRADELFMQKSGATAEAAMEQVFRETFGSDLQEKRK